MTWIILPSLGIIVGLLSGLLGIGGGVILVPMLVLILPVIGVGKDIAIHLALGSSLACTTFTLLSASLTHVSNGNIDRAVLRKLLPGIILGAIIGPGIVHFLPAELLRRIIGLLLFALAVNMAFDYKIPTHRKLPNIKIIIISTTIISIISTFAGLSGTVFIVPYLMWFAMPIRIAVGTATMCGLPLALIGMISYIFLGYNAPNLPDYALGYVYWPAIIMISLTSIPTTRIATKLALKVPKEIMKRLLAILLTLVSGEMLFF
jgi:uncharacterized membrane protein YfcA